MGLFLIARRVDVMRWMWMVTAWDYLSRWVWLSLALCLVDGWYGIYGLDGRLGGNGIDKLDS